MGAGVFVMTTVGDGRTQSLECHWCQTLLLTLRGSLEPVWSPLRPDISLRPVPAIHVTGTVNGIELYDFPSSTE